MSGTFDVTDANWTAMGRIIQPLGGLIQTLTRIYDEQGLLLEPTAADQELARDAIDAWQQLSKVAQAAVTARDRAHKFAVEQVRKSGPVPYGDRDRENWILETVPYGGTSLVQDYPGRRKPTAH